jgi:NAD(P)H-quinone oxidoreductase subunit 5
LQIYLLPLLAIFPVIYRCLATYRPQLLFNPLIYSGALFFACLTGFCFLNDAKIEWELLTIPLSADRPFVTLGLSIDVLSGLVGTTVLVIGAVVSRFSFKYLEDDPNRSLFMKNLSWTMSSVLMMLMSQNLILFFGAWVLTSYFLHQLLTHFHLRKEALKAARQKFWISRVGDLFILSSSLMIFLIFKTLDFDLIFNAVNDEKFVIANDASIHIAAFLLILGAMAKSAQFPFHFWLPNTMETPTPVSAIMHAGIINAGGYLIIRMSPLLAVAPMSLMLLAFVGGFTIFYAVLVMLTQTNIKKSLAYSTIAQMGFMMLQCGLGVFHLAVLHIVAHAFYKAYVFLSANTATDLGKLQRYFPEESDGHNLWSPFLFAMFSIAGVFGGALLAGFNIIEKPGEAILLFIFSLALAQIILVSKNKFGAIVIALVFGITYKVLGEGMQSLLTTNIAQAPSFNIYETSLYLLVIPLFAALYFMQNNLEFINKTNWGRKLYVKIYSIGS